MKHKTEKRRFLTGISMFSVIFSAEKRHRKLQLTKIEEYIHFSKLSKYKVISGPYFLYSVSLRIQSE